MAKRARTSSDRSKKSRRATSPSPEVQTFARLEPPGVPSGQAVVAFEAAMKTMQAHDYARAGEAFRRLIDEFPAERALLDRARVYLGLCEREVRRQPRAPETVEERMTAATAAHNMHDEGQAERLVKTVLAEDPHHDLALYLLAAIEARRGNLTQALARLSEAIAVSPDVSAQARHDEDFAPLRRSEEFQRLTEIPEDGSGRRGRRTRTPR